MLLYSEYESNWKMHKVLLAVSTTIQNELLCVCTFICVWIFRSDLYMYGLIILVLLFILLGCTGRE